jgi:ABC-2 type transport system permease protein
MISPLSSGSAPQTSPSLAPPSPLGKGVGGWGEAATLPPPGTFAAMLADTWLLLRLRWQMGLNKFRRRSRATQIFSVLGMLMIAGIFGSLSAFIGLGSGWLFRVMPGVHGLEGLVPGAILTLVTILLFFTSFGVALGSLFLSSDLELLMIAPVDRRAVFMSKLLDGIESNYAIIGVLGLPALITYGIGQGFGPLYYLLALPALLVAPLLPEGLGALAVLIVARFAPARRVREALALAAALFGLGCSAIGQTSRLWFQPPVGRPGARPDFAALQTTVDQFNSLPLPSLVAGRGLAAAGRGDVVGATVGLAGFVLITVVFFAGCVWLAERLYASGWVRMQSSGTARRSQARVARDAARSGLLGRAPVALAVALKDWRMIPRDLRNFAQLLGPMVMLPVVYFNLLGGSGRRSINLIEATERFTGAQIDTTGIIIAAGILTTTVLIFTQTATTAISMENKAWWILKIAPIAPWDLVRGKFLTAWVPFAGLSTLLLIAAGIWRGFSLLGLAYGWFGIQLLGAGVLAMALGFGMRWPRLGWDNPKQMNSGWAAIATLAGEALVGLLGGFFLCLPILAQMVAPDLVIAAWVLGPLLAAGVTAAGAWAALAIGMENLPTVGEM